MSRYEPRATPGPLIALLLAVTVILAGRWAGAQVDRGQPVARGQELQLGADVTKVVGLPNGPSLSGLELERRTEALSSRMRCPVCQGNAVSDSPSESARNMKSQVRAMIAAGYDDDQIFLYFETSYGEFIRLMPRAEGFNLLVWATPLAALLIGLVAVVLMVRRRSVGELPASAAAADSADAAGAAQPDGPGEADAALEPWIAQVRREVGGKDA